MKTGKEKKVYSCSTCINDSYFDTWSISWAQNGMKVNDEIKSNFNLDDTFIKKIQYWSDKKMEEGNIGWISTFSDLKTLNEYKNTFFPKVDTHTLSINFPETERNELLEIFNPEKSNFDEIGISKNLTNKIEENTSEKNIGYDLIGLEETGNFHSFHCHDIASDLIQEFKIEINKYGLIKENNKWSKMVEYMNDEINGFKPCPWFYVKVNQVIN